MSTLASSGAPAPAAQGAAAPRADPPPPEDPRWRTALEEVVRSPELLSLHAQPIVELTTGAIAGYEALSRFDATVGGVRATPDRWFAAAEHWGLNARLQARVVANGADMRAVLPPDTFLTVNVEPHLITRPEVCEPLLERGDLSRLVVELTEHTLAEDPEELQRVLDRLREAGALIAMDDAGTGYAGLGQLLVLRPSIVKLDRELISGIDTDPVKRAIMEVLGDLVGRMDGWVLAEGIETLAELDCVVGMGAALGQGYVLARPTPAMLTEIADDLVMRIRSTAARAQFDEHIVSLVQPAMCGTDPGCEVLLAADGRPQAVRWGGTGAGDVPRWSPAMVVAPSASFAEVARRAATRPPAHVGAPLVCTDGSGTVVGIITQAALLSGLARSR